MRILAIEDDTVVQESLRVSLEAFGHIVDLTAAGEDGEHFALNYHYDAILLDLGLPDIGGLDLLKRMRARKVKAPIIVTSGLNVVEIKVRALGWGADDYVVKPWHTEELRERINAVIRRSRGVPDAIVTNGDMRINLSERRVTIALNEVKLTALEMSMMEALANADGRTVTKAMLHERLYNSHVYTVPKIIDVVICHLRKKFAAASGGRNYIATEFGVGYRLCEPDRCPETKSPGRPTGVGQADFKRQRAEAEQQFQTASI